MLWETISAAKDLRRLHELASIMIRYGFGDLVRRLDMADLFERAGARRLGGNGSDFRQTGSDYGHARGSLHPGLDRRV